MKHLMAALLILASLGVVGEGKALELKRLPHSWDYASDYGEVISPVVIYVALPLAYICTNDYEYRDVYIYGRNGDKKIFSVLSRRSPAHP